MIVLTTGKNRTGKDFTVTKILYRIWLRTGIQIYTNQPLKFKKPRFNKWRVKEFKNPQGFIELEQVFHVNNCIIYFTEGQELFSARGWESLPDRFKRLLNLNGHSRIDLYTTTPNAGSIDVEYRRKIHKWIHCKRLFQIGKYKSYFGIFYYRFKDDDYFTSRTLEAIDIPDKPVRFWQALRLNYCIHYFSKQLYNCEQQFQFKNYRVICYSTHANPNQYKYWIFPKHLSLTLAKRSISTFKSTLPTTK